MRTNQLTKHIFAQCIAVILAILILPSTATAQSPGANLTKMVAPPPVPTTKILAIGRLNSKANPSSMREVMTSEVRETMALYLAGKIDQWYFKQDKSGVVFLLNISSVEEARDMLDKLPLGRVGLMEFELVPLGPLSPLYMLLLPASNAGSN